MPCLVRRDTLCGFCGDDFYTEGEPSALDEVDQTIVDCFQAKIMQRLGGEGTVLRRVLVWNETGFFLQPDPKHFQNLAELLEVSGVKPAPTPISKRDGADVERRAGTTRQSGGDPGICMYPGPDRYDVQFTVKGLASDMQAPMRLCMARLRRLVRDPCGTLHIGMFHMNQDKEVELTVWTDGDRSGDVQTCKSTSSGAIQIRAHTVETWSVSQKFVSLSSAESEFAAIGGGTSRGLTFKHVLQEVFGQHQARSKDTDGGENRQRRGQVHVAQSGLRASPPSGHEISVAPRRAQGRVSSKLSGSRRRTTLLTSKETRERLLGVQSRNRLCVDRRAESVGSAFALARSSVQSARAHCGTVLTLRDEIHGVGVLQTVIVTLAVKMLACAAMCTCQSGTGVRRRGFPRDGC